MERKLATSVPRRCLVAKPSPRSCDFRFHAELNDFLAPMRRGRGFVHAFDGTPAVKDRIESLGVPHTEVDLVLVDGGPVGFAHRLRGGEQVAVYPHDAGPQVDGTVRLQPRPPGEPQFVLDVHLGRLAAYLRLLGFDSLYRNDYRDDELLAIARLGDRTVLTRDTGLLKHAGLSRGAFVHQTDPRRQLREVLDRFALWTRIRPFDRCARCNGLVERLPEANVPDGVPDAIARRHDVFSRCSGCGQVYWQGSHQERLRRRLAQVGVAI